ncbi:hypothetical protein CE139_19100 [Pseudomonas oryzihabitans]|uniref:Uncharacterized protein n=1 Tax=Pseudomonas oryzihabitans TaxID=47885 RepID=A0A2Z5AAE7_9PSED|nr:hypothetical protein CE139_19100 [Pseudomonas oryzihabitans]
MLADRRMAPASPKLVDCISDYVVEQWGIGDQGPVEGAGDPGRSFRVDQRDDEVVTLRLQIVLQRRV